MCRGAFRRPLRRPKNGGAGLICRDVVMYSSSGRSGFVHELPSKDIAVISKSLNQSTILKGNLRVRLHNHVDQLPPGVLLLIRITVRLSVV